MQTSFYVFSSSRPRHIALAVEHRIWKIHCSEHQQRQLYGKAEGKIFPGDRGVFYDSIFQRLTVPFEFTSEVEYTLGDDPFERIEGERYRLEFSLSPLGSTSRSVPFEKLPENIQRAVNPLLVFQRCTIEEEEWLPIFGELSRAD